MKPMVNKKNIEDVYPMSDIEKGMVYHSLKETGHSVYHNQTIFQEKIENFDSALLKKAVALLVEKHPILRTGFDLYNFKEPVQIVFRKISLDIRHLDISHMKKEKQETHLKLFLAADKDASFNFNRPEPLWRMRTFALGGGNICFMWICHHAITDGWSTASLMTELNNTYLKLKLNPAYGLKNLKNTYKTYVMQQLLEKRNKNTIAFWKKELAGYKRFVFPPPLYTTESQETKEYISHMGVSLHKDLAHFARTRGTSVKNLCFAAYVFMLNMLAYETEMVVGLVTHNRPICEDGSKILGCFLNTIPVRIKIPAGIKWSDYIRLVDKKLLELMNYSSFSLRELVKIIGEDSRGRNPLFDTTFNFVDFYIYNEAEADYSRQRNVNSNTTRGKRISIQGSIITNTLLNFRIDSGSGNFYAAVSYNTSVIDDDRVKELCLCFRQILKVFIDEPGSKVNRDALIPPEEKKKLLFDFNRTRATYPGNKTVHGLFSEQAEKTPDAIALVGPIDREKNNRDVHVTFKTADEQSLCLARLLRKKGIAPGAITAIMADRSILMIVGIWGILKAGAAYLPIDPEFPPARINYMLNDSNTPVLVSTVSEINKQKNDCDRITHSRVDFDREIVSLEETLPGPAGSNSRPTPAFTRPSLSWFFAPPSSPVYVIYTSGTTGKPKGVLLKHRNLVNYVNWFRKKICLVPGDNALLTSSYAFDLGYTSIYPSLLSGASLHIIPKEINLSAEGLLKYISKKHITYLKVTPSLCSIIIGSRLFSAENCRSLRLVVMGGEAIRLEDVEKIHRVGGHIGIMNHYGPTEATIGMIATLIDFNRFREYKKNPVIGKPINNAGVHILAKDLSLLPIGIPGELWISGACLARGYLNRPELTAEKFVRTDKRLYRTGDLARWLPDSTIEFLGRIDQQIKVRGYRIEAGEIESKLVKHEEIKDAVVIEIKDKNNNAHLAAYCVPAETKKGHFNAIVLKEYLLKDLPPYMVPTYFVPLDKIPLTDNGKLDRKSLPEPAVKVQDVYVPPEDEIEQRLVRIWSEILGIENKIVSIDANFFELGGHSLNAIALISRIHRVFNVNLPLAVFFENSTVRLAAELIKKTGQDIFSSIKPAEKKEYYPFTSAQKRMFFVDSARQDTGYNMPKLMRLEGRVDREKLTNVFQTLIERHESFRTSFVIIKDNLVQQVRYPRDIHFKLQYYELQETEVKGILKDFFRRFDLSRAPLIRVGLIKLDETRYIFMIDAHHIIMDELSWDLLLEEFGILYHGGKGTLPPLSVQYTDFAEWLDSRQQKEAVKQQEEFWLRQFSAGIPVLHLPLDYERPSIQEYAAEDVPFEINPAETALIKSMVLKENATLYMGLLALFNVFLAKITGQSDILVGTALAGRKHDDLERVVGLFVNTLVLWNCPEGEKSFREFLKELKENTLQAFENQQYQFDDLVDNLKLDRQLSRNPLFDVTFFLRNMDDQSRKSANIKFADFNISPYQQVIRNEGKFDLSLECFDKGESLTLVFRYCKSLFKRETIAGFINLFRRLVSSACASPAKQISEIEIISGEYKRQILLEFNNTRVEYPREKTINQLFNEQVEKTPDNIALIDVGHDPVNHSPGNGTREMYLTYRELDNKINQLVRRLQAGGIAPGSIVTLLAYRSIEVIAAMFAILDTGGVFLPLDPQYPPARKRFIMKDSGSQLLLTHQRLYQNDRDMIRSIFREKVILLDARNDDSTGAAAPLPPKMMPVTAANPVYVIYTSGTTGKPKGVLIEGQGLVNYISWAIKQYVKNEKVHFPLFTSISFDLTITSIFAPLLSGNAVLVYGRENKEPLIEKVINDNNAGVVKLTPTHLKILRDKKPGAANIKRLIVGGEELPANLALETWKNFDKKIEIYNEYGPTETVVGCMIYKYNPGQDTNRGVPIGLPAQNTCIYICDRYLKLVPPGIPGELFIGGHGVARGYLNRVELTAARFIPSPFIKGNRLYKTGDLARWLPDDLHHIEFLGRVDQQVKIRGYRIETGEIESQLSTHEEIQDALVMIREDKDGSKYLCAYIVPDHVKTPGENPASSLSSQLRKFLSRSLPDYMIPAHFVEIDRIPFTSNGKVNRSALPAPRLTAGEDYVAPTNPLEARLVRLWSGVLAIETSVIGIDSNFFELGGHSLKAIIMVSKVHKELNVKIPLAVVFKYPTIRGLAEFIKEAAEDRYASIEAAEKKEYYALSSVQQRLYILHRMNPAGTAYNMWEIIPLTGDIDGHKLEKVFKTLIQRHESLRTSFEMVKTEPGQKVNKSVDFKLEYREIPGGITREGPQANTLWESIIKQFIRPFDLARAPLLRIQLVKWAGKFFLIVDIHHIIYDGVSHQILVQDFMALYRGEQLLPLRIQYKDFSQWQNQDKRNQSLDQQEEYWLKKYQGEIPILELPVDFPRPLVQSFEGNAIKFELLGRETRALKALALDAGLTLFMVLLGIINILLARLSNQEDIVIGTPITGRPHADLEKIIGMFVNTLPLRNYPRGQLSSREFLQEVKKDTLAAFENQEYQFEDLVEKVAVKRDTGRNPLFDVLFHLKNITANVRDISSEEASPQPITGPGAAPKDYERILRTSKFDLSITAEESGEKILCSFQYCTKIFKKETIQRFITYYKNIVSSMINSPELPLSQLEIMSPGEKEFILHTFNHTGHLFPAEKTIRQLFEEQVKKKPDHIAAAGIDATANTGIFITYRQLNQRADQLAAVLIDKQPGPGCTVAIMSDPSPGMMVGILAVLKTGAGYLPLDPETPEGRINYILNDSEAKLLLTRTHLVNQVVFAGETLNFEDESLYKIKDANPVRIPLATEGQMVYMIYTSGTTGKPKGVQLTHKNLVNYVTWFSTAAGLTDTDKTVLTSSFAFDLGYTSIYPSLLNGAQLHILRKQDYMLPPVLLDYIRTREISYLKMTPSLFSALVKDSRFSSDACSTLRLVVLGGEAIIPADVEIAYQTCKHMRIMNHYGPTEVTIGCIAQFIDAHHLETYKNQPTIGKPIFNTRVFILDKYFKPTPPGITGELCLSGAGVAKGYFKQDQLTAEKFVHNPFNTEKHSSPFCDRIYRTGDLARWLPQGNIEFQGRMDHQVKIRGYRIELGEIETHLQEHIGIKEVVVLARADSTSTQYLCAYIVPHANLSDSTTSLESSQLKKYLSYYLADYMIPSYFIRLEELPLTPNGKLDRGALPHPQISTQEEFVAPRNSIEDTLAGIWAEVLEINKEKVSITSSFFELGGHSLRAVMVISRIHRALDVNVPLAEMFKTPTIKGISAYISAARPEVFVSIETTEKKEYYPVSPAQKRMYILQQMTVESTVYNMPSIIELDKETDVVRLETVFKQLIRRHESLRTSFDIALGQPVQKIHPDVPFTCQYYESEPPGRENDPAGTPDYPTTDRIIRDFIRPFDLTRAPLFRAGVLKTGAGNYLLLTDLHHIISDGLSRMKLEQDFLAFYRGETLPPLRIQYKDFSQWQNSEKQREKIKEQEKYWLNQFASEIPVLNLPVDYPRQAVLSFAGSTADMTLSPEETAACKGFSLETGGTLFMTLQAVLNVLLARICSQEDIVIGSPTAGRRHADLDNVMGMFVNTLALRNYPRGEKTITEFLTEIKHHTLDAFDNQEYPLEDLVENVTRQRDTSRNPLFDVMLVLQNINPNEKPNQNQSENTNGNKIETNTPPSPYNNDYENRISKFDISLIAREIDARLQFHVQYRTSLFKRETIERFMAYIKMIILSITENPHLKLCQIDVIPGEEKRRLLIEFNDTTTEYPRNRTIPQLFQEQVKKIPDHIAVAARNADGSRPARDKTGTQSTLGHAITYRELDQQSDQLADRLRVMGVKIDTIVGIMVERSLAMITGMLGILKAGGAYLPIEPDYPEERRQFMLKDSGASLMVTAGDLHEDKKTGSGEKRKNPGIIFINSPYLRGFQSPRFPLFPATHSTNLAYVIYTSGSTGKPKGVLIEHKAFASLRDYQVKNFKINEKDRIIQFASSAFDASVWEIYIALLNGAVLCIADQEVIGDYQVFEDYLRQNHITLAALPPTYAAYLNVNQLTSLRVLITAGSAPPPDLVNKWMDHFQYFNGYGPTETTICTSIWRAENKNNALPRVKIGKPISNTYAYILDCHKNLQPIGIPGELCVGGAGLARGYLNRPGLTDERFITTDFSLDEQKRLYRTGDLCKRLADGNMEFLGRIDHQVKIRGYRIELGEIENQLLNIAEVKEAVVLARNESKGNQYLCAYIVADTTAENSIDTPGFKKHLSRSLPGYMIPSYFIHVEKIPLTANGKTDQNALPTPEAVSNSAYTAPRDELEIKLTAIWRDLLRTGASTGQAQSVKTHAAIGINDNFFELGGHSLNAALMSRKIHHVFHVNVPLVEIFKTPTIKALAEYIRINRKDTLDLAINNLTLLKPGVGSDAHLFFIHDGTGEVSGYIELCQHLTDNFNYWGIRADHLENLAPRHLTIKKLARKYIKEIKQIQTHGPYYIAGWSLGGSIAFEMTRQLEQKKEEIKFLAIIDSPSPQHELTGRELSQFTNQAGQFNRKSQRQWILHYLPHQGIKEKLERVTDASRLWLSLADYLEETSFDIKKIRELIPGNMARAIPNVDKLGIKELIHYINIIRSLINARSLYIPEGKINTAIHYIKASESNTINEKNWAEYCNNAIHFNEIPGSHFSILQNPGVVKVARLFDRANKVVFKSPGG